MKTIALKANPSYRGGAFRRFKYAAFRHPFDEWANIFDADTLSFGFAPKVEWDKYDIAICFIHDGGIGGPSHVRKIAPQLKIVSILEPPPNFYTRREWRGHLFEQFKWDIHNSDIVGIQPPYEIEFRQFFKTSKIHGLNNPINIPEYRKYINLEERKLIIAGTGHCNFSDSSKHAWKIMEATKGMLRSPYKFRMFYTTKEEARRAGYHGIEACPFIWSYLEHIKRLNECSVFVDDSTGFTGHMALELACLEVPSVGSNCYTSQLLPELSFSPRTYTKGQPRWRKSGEIRQLAGYVARLANEESFYKESVVKMTDNLNKKFSYRVMRKRLLELLNWEEK